MTDSEREQAIERQRQLLTESADAAVQRVAFERMCELIAQRSPEQVEQMERERGLR
jgi:hypothetical protein